jgi:hypothetical protein
VPLKCIILEAQTAISIVSESTTELKKGFNKMAWCSVRTYVLI